MTVTVIEGDCLVTLPVVFPDNWFDSCVTDPPYHLTSIVKRSGAPGAAPAQAGVYARGAAGFMGQTWDGGDVAFRPETWAEVYRVLKPGAHLLAFGGTRGFHRLACAIEDAGFEVLAAFPDTAPSSARPRNNAARGVTKAEGAESAHVTQGHGGSGSAARFFYYAKASQAERAGSGHPTIKPVALMRWLVRLVTPPGGKVLDPFAGSGTTGVAAALEGFDAVLLEREPEYVAGIRRRTA